jgi:hypothetical protein
MRTIVCWALLAVLILLALPLLQDVAVPFAQQHHSYDNPMRIVSTLADFARRIGDIPSLAYVLAFVGGMTFAALIDAFLRRIEQRHSKNYALLGDKAIHLSQLIESELGSAHRRRDHPPPSLLAEVNSLMVDLKRVGIAVPLPPKGTEVDKWLEMAGVYYGHVGPLLRDGHIKETEDIAGLVQMRLSST